jgi:chemotaxis protein CheD
VTIQARPDPPQIVSVAMACWAVAPAPTQLRTLLGSCAGVVLHDRVAQIGGMAHIVLPNSRGCADHPGKFADTAIPGMIEDISRLLGRRALGRLTAKIIGGASMFRTGPALSIGQWNQDAVEQILAGLGIPILARDVGGEAGRRVTFDTISGVVAIRVPGGDSYEI